MGGPGGGEGRNFRGAHLLCFRKNLENKQAPIQHPDHVIFFSSADAKVDSRGQCFTCQTGSLNRASVSLTLLV